MKKLLAIILASLVVLALAAGCSNKEEPAKTAVSTAETTVSTQPQEQPLAATAAPSLTTPSESFQASGTTKSNTVTESQEVMGDKLVMKETGSHEYHGTLEGKLIIKFTVELSMDGTFTLTGDGTFTGSVNGREGTLTTRHNATGRASASGSGTIRDEVSIVSGTGGLSDLHGTLIAEGTVGEIAEGTYSGMLSFGTETPPPETVVSPTPKAPVSSALAGANARGTVKITDQVNNSPMVMEHGIWSTNITTTFEYHGDLEGTLVETGITKVDGMSGKVTGDTVGTFTGTVQGKQGTFTVSGDWASQFMSQTEGFGGCTYTILIGTGELQGLEGTLVLNTTTKKGICEGTYEGALTFGE